ncbi:MAG: glycosyltransferase family 4 protein [Candidatus Brocadiaceae bacterium]|nr:glycosyltransferase family 4 protein [Candidatus Brocadiaceae bacterium]
MNLAYSLPVYWPAIGGCEVHTKEVVKRMTKDHCVKVITLINSQDEKLRSDSLWKAATIYASGMSQRYFDEGAEIQKISLNPSWRMMLYPFVKSARLYRIIEPLSMMILNQLFQHKIALFLGNSDVVHSIFGGVSFLSYATLKFSRKKNIPFVFTPLLHLSYESWQKQLSRHENKGKDIEYKPVLHFSPMFYHDKYWLYTCKEADALITMTEYEREFFISSLGINPKKVHHIGVGPVVSDKPDPLRIREKYKIASNQTIVLFVGRNHELKGIEEICLAARLVWDKHPKTYFFFVGPKEGNSGAILAKYSDNRIIVIDKVSLEEKTDFLSACDAFCMPSIAESFGGVYLEAWMFEKPIIGCPIPPTKELTENGKGGFLVNLAPDEIAEKIIEIIERKDIAKKMGIWGKQKAQTLYNWDTIADKLNRIYSAVV